MRRGTRVGQAYVAVTADGSGINKDIVDSVDEAGPNVEKAGKKHGERYGDGFEDSLDFDGIIDKMGQEMGRRLDKQADTIGRSFSQRFSRAMDRASDKMGRNLSEALTESLDDTLATFGRMIDTMESRLSTVSGNAGGGGGGGNTTPGAGNQQPGAKQVLYKDYDFAALFESARTKLHLDANKAIEDDDLRLHKSQQSLYDSVLKMEEAKATFLGKFELAREKLRLDSNKVIAADDAALHKSQQAILDTQLKMEQAKATFIGKFEEARAALHEKSNTVIFKDDLALVREQQGLFDRLAAEAKKRDMDLWAVRNATAKAHYKYLADLERGRIDEQGNTIRLGGGGDSDRLGDKIGKAFGAGSRNNALNLFGRTLGNIVKLTEKGVGFAQKFAKGFSEAGEGASLIQKTLAGFSGGGAGMGEGLSSIAASAPAAAAGVAAVAVAMTVLVTVAGALLAIVTALAAAIASALVGALLVGTAGLVAMAAAGGLVVAAFMSMTEAQRTLLSDAFVPLHEEMIGIGQLMITQMIPYFDQWSTNLQQALLLAAPVAQVMGQAFGQAGAALSKALSGPGFQNLATALGTYLPSIVLKLTNAFGSFLNGVTGIFAALMPLVNQFSGYLADVAERFSVWANSAQGQNSIEDFANRAVAALRSVWDFVREFSGFVFDVLFNPSSQKAGSTIFDGLADAFASFRKKISDGSLEKWFNDAIQFGSQLWGVMKALGDAFITLYNSGVLESVGTGFESLAMVIDALTTIFDPLITILGYTLPAAMAAAITPLEAVAASVISIGESIEWVGGLLNKITPGNAFGNGAEWSHAADQWKGIGDQWADAFSGSGSGSSPGASGTGIGAAEHGLGPGGAQMPQLPNIDLPSLISSGHTALSNTYQSHGGYLPDPKDKDKKKPKYHNPYVAYANSLIDNGPSAMTQIKNLLTKANRTFLGAVRAANEALVQGLRDANTDAAKAIRGAAQATDSDSVISSLQNLTEQMSTNSINAAQTLYRNAQTTANSMRSGADAAVASAQSALNSAATRLANAGSKKEAKEALAAVNKAKRDLAAAKAARETIYGQASALVDKARDDGLVLESRIITANQIIADQTVLDWGNVQAIINNGGRYANATLADYAEARAFVADQIKQANEKLVDAISMRDDYADAVAGSIKAFGALTTAQAKTINGVQQALTFTDITDNLQARLDKIKKFQDNLRTLLALGLSDEAYKQIVDMGVEGGSAFADALVAGGQGAVSQTNNLTSQIGDIADNLGIEASNRLYQAGVDAAQGLVDGLTSLSAELDSAATELGESIANAVKRALGIASPSKVMIGMMDYVGDGAVIGLDRQSGKVGAAASRFSDNIAVSPEVAAYAARQGQADPVSGNGQRPIDLTIITPTEDPHAVALETLNELTGRL